MQHATQTQIDEYWNELLNEQQNRQVASTIRQSLMAPGTVQDANNNWHEGSFDSPEESLNYHFDIHGEEVGAQNEEEYLRKAEAFKSNLKGANKSSVDGFTEGVTRYTKNGRYIDLGSDGRIVSFGSVNN